MVHLKLVDHMDWEWLFKNLPKISAVLFFLMSIVVPPLIGLVLFVLQVVTVAAGCSIALTPMICVVALLCIGLGLMTRNMGVLERTVYVGAGLGAMGGWILLFSLSAWGGLFALPLFGPGVVWFVLSPFIWGVFALLVGAIVGVAVVGMVLQCCFRRVGGREFIGMQQQGHRYYNGGLLHVDPAKRPILVATRRRGFCFWAAAQDEAMTDVEQRREQQVLVSSFSFKC